MANALAQESSPYLRQHAENPVDWLPWGPDAHARAIREDKPLLVSIGYSACHWCHVMERESFTDARTAALMNENPTPSEPEIREALSGNVCRCTGYQSIVAGVLRATGQSPISDSTHQE